MKNLFYLILSIFITSCSKDEEPLAKVLVTPSLGWEMVGVENNILELSITITSSESLPSGKLEFKVDNELVNTFTPTKNTNKFKTSYSFNDVSEHNASLAYTFTDGRTPIQKLIKIKKVLNETVTRSSNENWTSF